MSNKSKVIYLARQEKTKIGSKNPILVKYTSWVFIAGNVIYVWELIQQQTSNSIVGTIKLNLSDLQLFMFRHFEKEIYKSLHYNIQWFDQHRHPAPYMSRTLVISFRGFHFPYAKDDNYKMKWNYLLETNIHFLLSPTPFKEIFLTLHVHNILYSQQQPLTQSSNEIL